MQKIFPCYFIETWLRNWKAYRLINQLINLFGGAVQNSKFN